MPWFSFKLIKEPDKRSIKEWRIFRDMAPLLTRTVVPLASRIASKVISRLVTGALSRVAGTGVSKLFGKGLATVNNKDDFVRKARPYLTQTQIDSTKFTI